MFLPILSSPQDSSCKVNKNDYLLIYPLHTYHKKKKEEGKDKEKKSLKIWIIIIPESGLKFSSKISALCWRVGDWEVPHFMKLSLGRYDHEYRHIAITVILWSKFENDVKNKSPL